MSKKPRSSDCQDDGANDNGHEVVPSDDSPKASNPSATSTANELPPLPRTPIQLIATILYLHAEEKDDTKAKYLRRLINRLINAVLLILFTIVILAAAAVLLAYRVDLGPLFSKIPGWVVMLFGLGTPATIVSTILFKRRKSKTAG